MVNSSASLPSVFSLTVPPLSPANHDAPPHQDPSRPSGRYRSPILALFLVGTRWLTAAIGGDPDIEELPVAG